jgi:hypothetical protein
MASPIKATYEVPEVSGWTRWFSFISQNADSPRCQAILLVAAAVLYLLCYLANPCCPGIIRSIPETKDRLGRQGQRYVRASYSWNVIEAVYKSILANNDNRTPSRQRLCPAILLRLIGP